MTNQPHVPGTVETALSEFDDTGEYWTLPRGNPLRDLLDATAASGTEPTREQVAALPCSAERPAHWRLVVAELAADVARARRAGQNGVARGLVRELEAEVAQGAGPAPDDEPADDARTPVEIAASVRR